MEYILCRKCETGNPSFYRVCENCKTDLFGFEDDSTEKLADGNINRMTEEEERNADKSLAKKAVIASVFTTAFKVWFLYALANNSHQSFLQIKFLSVLALPIIAAIIAFAKYKKWYWILLLDSAGMVLLFIGGLFFYIVGVMGK
jgi:VIT1/CCC1 family predicted Fe2+/Mn2+ transporter